MSARPDLPTCPHPDAERVWMPTVISRWTDPDRGQVKHLIPSPFCEACTKTITHEQLIPQYAWDAAMRAMKKQGYGPMPRSLNTVVWERKESFEKLQGQIQRGDGFKTIAREEISE